VRPDKVLDLMSGARERYETVRADLRYRGDGTTIKSLREQHEQALRLSGSRRRSSGQIKHSEPDGAFGWRCRIWQVGAYRWRRELDLPGGGTEITGCYGTNFSGFPKMWHLRASTLPSGDDPEWLIYAQDYYWTFYFVDDDISGLPRVLDGLDLRVEGETEWAGRRAVRLLGMPPAGEWDRQDDPDPLAWGADEYELLVDRERGIVLRCANKLKGAEFDVLEMEEVYFDEHFAEEVLLPPQPLSYW